MDYKKYEVRRIHQFILSELETLKGKSFEEKTARGNVLYNISKAAENYNDLEEIIEKYFTQKAIKQNDEKEI